MNAPATALSVSTDKIIAGKAAGVGYLRFNQPEKHNAISYGMWVAINEVMRSFRDDDEVRVVVMSGEGGRAFSAGADISEFSEVRNTREQIEVYEAAGRAAYDAITHCPKPVIAAWAAGWRWRSARTSASLRTIRGSESRPRGSGSGTPTRACDPSSTSSGRPRRRRSCSPPGGSTLPMRSGWGS